MQNQTAIERRMAKAVQAIGDEGTGAASDIDLTLAAMAYAVEQDKLSQDRLAIRIETALDKLGDRLCPGGPAPATQPFTRSGMTPTRRDGATVGIGATIGAIVSAALLRWLG